MRDRRGRRLSIVLAPCTALALVAAGCGGSAPSNGIAAKPAKSIFDAAVNAMSKATSAEIAGSALQGSKRVTIDFHMFQHGDASGRFGLAPVLGQVIVAGGVAYYKGSAAFWQGLGTLGGSSLPAADIAKVANRWVSLGKSSGSSFAAFTLSGLASSMRAHPGKLTKTRTKTIDGQSVVGVEAAGEGTLWVATTGSPYPVEIERSSSGTTESVTFKDWNSGSPPAAPKGAVSVQSLLG